jgi:protein-tyrosine phosphatase
LRKRFSVLFVCTGNTCRSPLAEILLKDHLHRAGLRNVRVSSAGTAAREGGRASPHAKAVATSRGLSLAGFRSKPVTPRRVKTADLILTMGRAQKYEIMERWPDAAERIHVISDFSGSGRTDIDDPIGGPEQAYFECADLLADEAKRILSKLKRMLGQKARQE